MLRYNGIFNSLLAVLLLASCGQEENKSDPVSTTAQRNSSIDEVIRLLKAKNPEACTAALPLAATNVRKIPFQIGREHLEAELQSRVSITGRDASFISYDSQEKTMTCRATFDLRWTSGSIPQPPAPEPDTFTVTLIDDVKVATRWGTAFPQARAIGAREQYYNEFYIELVAAEVTAEYDRFHANQSPSNNSSSFETSPSVVDSNRTQTPAAVSTTVNNAGSSSETRIPDTMEQELSSSIDQGLRGDDTGENYSILRPRTGTPLQIEIIQIIDAGNRTDFLVRLRNVGNAPLNGHFRLSCSTALGRSEGTVVASALGPGRRQHHILAVDGDSTTQGSCSVEQ